MFSARHPVIAAIAAVSLSLAPGCARQSSRPPDGAPRSGPARRIASLSPATTAILAELGAEDRLVAADTWSRLADPAGAVPRVDMIRPDAELLLSLAPDVVFASAMAREGTGHDPLEALSRAGIRVEYVPTSETLGDIERDILRVAEAIGERERGVGIARRMRERIDEIGRVCASVPADKRPLVVFEIAPAPAIYSFGSGVYLDELLSAAGARNAFSGERGWLATGAEAIVAANPDVILTNVDYLADPVAEILSRPGWSAVRAVANRRVYRIDGPSSSQPAPAVARALGEIARACHPELFDE